MVSLLQRVIVHVRKVDHSIQSQIVSMFWRMTWLPTLENFKGNRHESWSIKDGNTELCYYNYHKYRSILMRVCIKACGTTGAY